jgi:hypothetical protein
MAQMRPARLTLSHACYEPADAVLRLGNKKAAGIGGLGIGKIGWAAYGRT